MPPMTLRLLKWAAPIVAFLAFVLYVWPTPYRFDHVTVENDTYPVRIHRVTGRAEMLTPDDGWIPMQPEDDEPPRRSDPT